MKKPNIIYEILPYVYFCVGLFLIVSPRNGIALASGLIFMIIGGITWMMRYQNRKKLKLRIANEKLQETSKFRYAAIRWQKSFECGNSTIDGQHFELFNLGTELIEAIAQKATEREIELYLKKLIDHIIEHFRTEENVLELLEHPITPEHQEIHHRLLTKAQHLYNQYVSGEIEDNNLIVGFVVYDIITEHILKEDSRWFKQL